MLQYVHTDEDEKADTGAKIFVKHPAVLSRIFPDIT